MSLIKFNNYTPPNPSTYDIEFSDVNGESTTVEDGTDYIERVRSDVPEIKVGWTNLTQDEVTAITNEVSESVVNVEYFYGALYNAEMTASKRALKLKLRESNGNTYWNLSFTLKG